MAGDSNFQDLMRRVRGGDQEAATELVRRYEAAVRRTVRIRLFDSRLGRTLDSMDICQSVMASFLQRAALGQFELNTPDQLVKLLAEMARNKLVNQVRRQRAARRDMRRNELGMADNVDFAASGPTPSEQVANQELLQKIKQKLSADELQLLDLRDQGLEWGDIAARQGSTPEALRKKLARAFVRVRDELGLGDSH